MTSAATIAAERLPLELQGADFPYTRSGAHATPANGWLLVMAGVAAGFLALVAPLPFADNTAGVHNAREHLPCRPRLVMGSRQPGESRPPHMQG